MKDFKKNIYRNNTCPNCTAHDVTIGTQVWTGCNATVSTYANGDTIPQVSDQLTWSTLTTGAWCYYDNDPASEATYGKLYNGYAVNDARGFAPTGYHVPTDAEWTILTDYLGGLTVAGGKMKEDGLCHWISPNTDATNTSLFTGLPGGLRDQFGVYYSIGNFGLWWSSTEYDIDHIWYRPLYYNSGGVGRSYYLKRGALSVRFIKN